MNLVFPEFIAEVKDRIIALWKAAGYEHGFHKRNSLRKHLDVDRLSECDDWDKLREYETYLEGKADV